MSTCIDCGAPIGATATRCLRCHLHRVRKMCNRAEGPRCIDCGRPGPYLRCQECISREASERRETLQREKELRLQERRSIFICIGGCGGFITAFDTRCIECGGKYEQHSEQAAEIEEKDAA
jgi:hypothetical protein